jgi:rSAM/selenodomain-associated transferase 2
MRMISVVIPTLNEARRLPGLLATLARQAAPAETIVVDGGSADGTPALAAKAGATVLRVPAGRGGQLRAGAEAASGKVLLFLHADSVFPEDGLTQLAETLAARPEVVGGNFHVVFDGGDRFSRWLTGFYAWFRRHGLYYGDSGIFVRRAVYDRLGGIRPLALMEDYEFSRRLERAGPTCCLDGPLITSSRRFRGRHPVAIVAGWLWLHALYHLGVPPERLARIYRSARRSTAASAAFNDQS